MVVRGGLAPFPGLNRDGINAILCEHDTFLMMGRWRQDGRILPLAGDDGSHSSRVSNVLATLKMLNVPEHRHSAALVTPPRPNLVLQAQDKHPMKFFISPKLLCWIIDVQPVA